MTQYRDALHAFRRSTMRRNSLRWTLMFKHDPNSAGPTRIPAPPHHRGNCISRETGRGLGHIVRPALSRDGSHPALYHAVSPRIARRAGFRAVEKSNEHAQDRAHATAFRGSSADRQPPLYPHINSGGREPGCVRSGTGPITAPGAVYRIALSSKFGTARHRFFEAD